MIELEIPNHSWSKFGSDVLEFSGRSFLIVMDYYSKYPEVHHPFSKTVTGSVNVLKPTFARHGIPDSFVSDNMPFASAVLLEFARDWGFSLITSSPLYPQSNGQSERFLQTAKTWCGRHWRTPENPILLCQDTPLNGASYSPAQVLMNSWVPVLDATNFPGSSKTKWCELKTHNDI